MGAAGHADRWEQYLADAPETQISEYDRGDLIVHSPTKRPHQEQWAS
jgi:hypothetical protein